jgi:4-hydroxy-tetrahydrodipicolinate synthase
MQTKEQTENRAGDLRRREFMQLLGVSAFGLVLSGYTSFGAEKTGARAKPGAKALRGLFPILSTPYTPDDKLDLECLANEVKFCNKGRVHGLAWPQIASGWTALHEDERLAGVEAILATGKGGKTALVIGVQSQDGNMQTVEKYAKHAAQHGADAIVSLPPQGVSDEKVLLEYYQQVGKMTDLPLFVQTQNEMSVDLVVNIFQTVPTARYVKDEASPGGGALGRIAEILKRTNGEMKVFSGQGVRTMINEMELGFSGHCPTVSLADVYAQAFDLFHAGKKAEAFAMFGRIQAFSTMGLSTGNPMMVARGMFKLTTRTRNAPAAAGVEPEPGAGGRGARGGGGRGRGGGGGGGGGAVGPARSPEEEVKAIRKALDTYLKPYLRGDLV